MTSPTGNLSAFAMYSRDVNLQKPDRKIDKSVKTKVVTTRSTNGRPIRAARGITPQNGGARKTLRRSVKRQRVDRSSDSSHSDDSSHQSMPGDVEIDDGHLEVESADNNTDDQVSDDESASDVTEADSDNGIPASYVEVPPTSSCGNDASDHSFKWLMSPLTPKLFFDEHFEKHPFHLERNNVNFYQGLFASDNITKIIKENYLKCGEHLDIVRYINEKRVPVESDQRLIPDYVWDSYMSGFSVRMRNPQAYHKPLWKLCSLLQEYFTSSVGANVYLTPPNAQGFPPHYDDIDAFILQIEGKKTWKVYHSGNEDKMLPRYSSGDLNIYDLPDPVLITELVPGDLLYMPRGFIHQALTTDDHSLHVTISTNQLNTWGDFLKRGLTKALELATANNVEFRKSVPKDYYDYMGCSFMPYEGERPCIQREAFLKKAKQLTREMVKYFQVDETADAHANDFLHSSMPPVLNKEELQRSVYGNGTKFHNGVAKGVSRVTPETKVRLIRRKALRLVTNEDGNRLGHTFSNSKNSREEEFMFVKVEDDCVAAIHTLFKMHPRYIVVKDLPLIKNLKDKVAFVDNLYYNGIVMTEEPLPPSPPSVD